MQSDRTKSLIHLHFIIFIWGFTSILGALIDLDSSAIVWFRMMVGALSIALYFILFLQTRLSYTPAHLNTIFWVGLLSPCTGYSFLCYKNFLHLTNPIHTFFCFFNDLLFRAAHLQATLPFL